MPNKLSSLNPTDKDFMATRIIDIVQLAVQDLRNNQDRQTHRDTFFKAYDIALYLLSDYEGSNMERVRTATELLGMVEEKIGKEYHR